LFNEQSLPFFIADKKGEFKPVYIFKSDQGQGDKRVTEKSKNEQKTFLRRYEWSSYSEVLEPKKRSEYLGSERVLEYIGGDKEEGRKRYEEFVLEGIADKEIANPMDKLKYQFLLGSDN